MLQIIIPKTDIKAKKGRLQYLIFCNAKTLSGLMGVCVGDALGVPVEFTSRIERIKSPVTSMQGYGTWDVPPGTWSDDSSLYIERNVNPNQRSGYNCTSLMAKV